MFPSAKKDKTCFFKCDRFFVLRVRAFNLKVLAAWRMLNGLVYISIAKKCQNSLARTCLVVSVPLERQIFMWKHVEEPWVLWVTATCPWHPNVDPSDPWSFRDAPRSNRGLREVLVQAGDFAGLPGETQWYRGSVGGALRGGGWGGPKHRSGRGPKAAGSMLRSLRHRWSVDMVQPGADGSLHFQ